MSREIAEEQLVQARQEIIDYIDDQFGGTTFTRMVDDFYPTPGYGKDIFGWAFWNLVNEGKIEYENGQVRLND